MLNQQKNMRGSSCHMKRNSGICTVLAVTAWSHPPPRECNVAESKCLQIDVWLLVVHLSHDLLQLITRKCVIMFLIKLRNISSNHIYKGWTCLYENIKYFLKILEISLYLKNYIFVKFNRFVKITTTLCFKNCE